MQVDLEEQKHSGDVGDKKSEAEEMEVNTFYVFNSDMCDLALRCFYSKDGSAHKFNSDPLCHQCLKRAMSWDYILWVFDQL